MTAVVQDLGTVEPKAPAKDQVQTFVREAYMDLMDIHGTNWLSKGGKDGKEVVDHGPVWIAFCTNGAVKQDGEAVMGVGVARFLKDKYPKLPSVVGGLINAQEGGRNQVICFQKQALYSFPHQEHWRNPPTMQRIFLSMKQLIAAVNQTPGITREHPIYVERPGYQPDPTRSLAWNKVAQELARAGADERFVFVAPVAAQNNGVGNVPVAELE